MKQTWMAFDAPNLIYRNFWAMGQLHHLGDPTGAILGYLRDFRTLLEAFNTPHGIHCFDGANGLRQQRCPYYKNSRRLRNDVAEDRMSGLRRQMERVRLETLPSLGQTNVFCHEGFEADDLIASVVKNTPKGDDVVVVSGDHDLFQLLSPRCCQWDPKEKKTLNERGFRARYGIVPRQWPMVLAIAGGHDDIPGCPRVGDRTALKFVKGELPASSVYHRRVVSWMHKGSDFQECLDLVQLPYAGCPDVRPTPQREIDHEVWKQVTESMGMRSLVGRFR